MKKYLEDDEKLVAIIIKNLQRGISANDIQAFQKIDKNHYNRIAKIILYDIQKYLNI